MSNKRLNCRVKEITHNVIEQEVNKKTFVNFGDFIDKAIEYYCSTHVIPYIKNKEQ